MGSLTSSLWSPSRSRGSCCDSQKKREAKRLKQEEEDRVKRMADKEKSDAAAALRKKEQDASEVDTSLLHNNLRNRTLLNKITWVVSRVIFRTLA